LVVAPSHRLQEADADLVDVSVWALVALPPGRDEELHPPLAGTALGED
jgi:hypothetical protein